MFLITRELLAKAAIALAVAGLLILGLQFLTIPKIFMLINRPGSILLYEGPVLISLAVLLAWFREWATCKLLWLFEEMHRWLSGIIITAAVSLEGVMHVVGIPHVEGWWIPLIGGGSLATLSIWLQKWRKELYGK